MNVDAGGRIPLTIVSGFLGSGKTTLIRAMMTDPEFANAAIVVNEFGEVGIDHHLFFQTDERVTLLRDGCACCARQDNLIEILLGLIRGVDRGTSPRLDSVVLETTGLADPAPILYTLVSDSVLSRRYRVQRVITTVDAVAGAKNFETYEEAIRQVTTADIVVITKVDLAPAAETESLARCINDLNPSATWEVRGSWRLVAGTAGEKGAKGAKGAKGTRGQRGRPGGSRHAPAKDGHLPSVHVAEHGMATHPAFLRSAEHWNQSIRAPDFGGESELLYRSTGNIASLSLDFDEPLDWRMLGLWLTMLLHCHGERVLRVKGLLDVGEAGPLLLDGVQHVVHSPHHLREWPDGPQRSRLVFIVRDLDPAQIRVSLQAFQALARSM